MCHNSYSYKLQFQQLKFFGNERESTVVKNRKKSREKVGQRKVMKMKKKSGCYFSGVRTGTFRTKAIQL